MAELDKLFHIPGLDKVEVEVDMLDFPYVENCNDWIKLAKIVEILKSGQEGYYPELMQVAEERLLQLMPFTEKKKYLALSRTASETEVLEAQTDLVKWVNESKDKIFALTENSFPGEFDLPEMEGLLNKAQVNKIKECYESIKFFSLSVVQRERKADRERRKGNECFKAGEFDRAVAYYTNSIALFAKVDMTWTNRAISYIKLELFDYAEMDCNVALYLNPSSIKGLTRRGISRLSQGKYKQAALDFNDALNMQPDSKELQKLLSQALEKFKDTEGTDLNLEESRMKLSTKSNLVAECAADSDASVQISFVGVADIADVELPSGAFHLWKKETLRSPNLCVDNAFFRVTINEEDDEQDGEDSDANQTAFVRINIEDGDNDEDCEHTIEKPAVVRIPIEIDESEDLSADNRQERAFQLKEMGNQLMAKNEFSSAVEAYTSSIATYRSIATINNRAQANLSLKNYDAAIVDCNLVLEDDPNNIKALFRRGKCYCEKNLFQLAEVDLRKAVELEPSNNSVFSLLNDVRILRANIEEQEKNVAALKLQSESLKTAGNEKMNNGEFRHALELYTEAIKLDPSNIAARSNRVLANLKLNLFADAISDATDIVNNATSNDTLKRKAIFRRAEAYYNQALAMVDRDKSLQSLKLSERDVLYLLQIEPSNAVVDLLQLVKHSLDAMNVSATPKKPSVSSKNEPSERHGTLKLSDNVSPLKSKDMSKKLQVPEEPPKTVYEFERCWKGLQTRPDMKLRYLETFKKSTYKKIFKEALSTDLLESVIEVLSLQDCSPNISKRALEGIMNMPSLELTISLLPVASQKHLHIILEKIKESTKSEEDKQSIELLVQKFAGFS